MHTPLSLSPAPTPRTAPAHFGPSALALAATVTLSGCFLFPSFPASLLEAGTSGPIDGASDAPGDAPVGDSAGDEASMLETSVDDAPLDGPIEESPGFDASEGGFDDGATEASLEAATDDVPAGPEVSIEAGPGPGGFEICSDTPPAGPFDPELVLAGEPNSRDLAFDNRGRVATGEAQIVLFDAAGSVRTPLTPGDPALAVFGMRYLPDGALVIGSSRAGSPGTVRIVPTSGSPIEMLEEGLGTASFLAVHPDGSVYVSDTTNSTVYRLARGRARQVAFMLAAGTGLSPTGLAISPDGRKLYVGSTVQRRVFEVPLGPDGLMMGAGMERSFTDGLFNAQGLAFDQCGRLYLTDRDRSRILRVPAGGGAPEVITTRPTSGTFAPWGLAFGRGAGFERNALYTIDSMSGAVYRIRVGVNGANIPGPPAGGSTGMSTDTRR